MSSFFRFLACIAPSMVIAQVTPVRCRGQFCRAMLALFRAQNSAANQGNTTPTIIVSGGAVTHFFVGGTHTQEIEASPDQSHCEAGRRNTQRREDVGIN